MIRSLFVAFVTVVVVSAGLFAAQPGGASGAKPIPVSVTRGTPGVNIEVFLNSPKMADAVVDATGSANWLLDLSNLGKTRIDIYVDVCKDGKVVQVKFVSGNGEAPPKDEGCDRKLAAVSFQSNCGAISINFDFRNFGAKVLGCGMKFTDPKILTTIGGVVLGGVLVGVSGGGGTTTQASGVTAPGAPTVVAPVTPVTPVAPVTPVVPPPAEPTPGTNPPQQPAAPIQFTVILVPSFEHPPNSNTSFTRTSIATNPPLNQTANWTAVVSGPGVVSGGTSSGALDGSGRGATQAVINSLGQYVWRVTVNFLGQTQVAEATVVVR